MSWTSWWQRWVPAWQARRALRPYVAKQKTTQRKMAGLIKDHPRAELSYQLVNDMGQASEVLMRLAATLRHWQEQSRRQHGVMPFFIETGRLEGKRPFVFIKPLAAEGWLFETNARGLVISQAVRIAERETFLRQREAWDQVLLYRPAGGEGLLRLSSHRFGQEHLSYVVYQEQLLKALAANVGMPFDEKLFARGASSR